MLPFRKKGAFLAGATIPPQCQVRSKTENPCPRRAAVEIQGVAFCGPCALEQEAYFAIGELVARGEERGLRGRVLVATLKRVRWESAGGGEGTAAGVHREPPVVHGTKPLALKSS